MWSGGVLSEQLSGMNPEIGPCRFLSSNSNMLCAGGWFNIKMPSYQCRKSHCGDKTIL